MSDFEKYIKDNKHKLEADQVDQRVWLAIENGMLKEKNKMKSHFIKFLLVALAMLIGAYAIYNNKQQGPVLNEANILAQYDLTKYNYTQQVSLKKQQLVNATVPQDRFDDFQILLQQLEFMDGQFQDYLLYIEQNGYQEFIGDQIQNFYKSKIELLDKIHQEVEKINYYEKLQPSNSNQVGIEI